MGWMDDPLVTDTPAPPIQPGSPPPPEGAAPAWAGDPIVSEPAQEPKTPEPSMGAVAKNSAAKGTANLLNTPITLMDLITRGLASLPYAGHFQSLQDAAQEPELKANAPMDIAKGAGLVKPENDPQTGPQRIVDMAIQSAIASAAVPGGGMVGAVKGAVVGGISGAAAQTTKELTKDFLGPTGSDLLAIAVGMGTPIMLSHLNAPPKSLLTEEGKFTLKEARNVGYVVEPSKVRQPSSKLETIAGKASIAQEAVVRNQEITNNMAAKALGLPEGTPLSPALLDTLKKKVEQPYQEVEALRASATNLPWFPRYHSANLGEELKQARADTTALYKAYYNNPDPGVLKAAKASAANAQSLEDDIDMIAKAVGKPELLTQLQAARQHRARIADVEMALNVADGNVSAPVIGRMLDKGRPLSGELKIVGKFAQAFPRVAREAASVPPSGVSGTDAAASAILATGGAAAAGGVEGAATGLLPLIRQPARSRVLSKGYQDKLLQTPTPGPSTGTTAARAGMVGKTLAQEPGE